jgi:two-component system sensor kinase FixL
MERIYRAVFEAAADGIFVIDAAGAIRFVNDAAGALLALDAAALIGRSLGEFVPDPAERAALVAPADAAGNCARREIEMQRDDSYRFPAEIVRRAVVGNDGRDGGPMLIVIAHDISARRAAHNTLHARDELLRAIIAMAPEAIIVIDPAGTIISFSAAAERIFGHQAAAMLGRNVRVLMPEPYRGQHDSYLARYLATGEKRIIGIGRVVVGQRADGTIFPIELQISEVEAGGRRLFAGFVRDLTEQQEAERRFQDLHTKLLHASRLSTLGRMATTLAHELNQPLSAIANYVQAGAHLLATGQAALLPKVADALARAGEQAARAGGIIQRLRGFVARGESEKTETDLNALVEEAAALALVGAREHGIHVTFALAPALPPVLVDRVQVQQVVLNLVRNAVEALQPCTRREITVTTTRGGDHAEISVADSGPGIAPEIRAEIFSPFVSTKPDGMGLGLSICREIVESQGGRLTVVSAPETGAVFRFTLPLAEEMRDDA